MRYLGRLACFALFLAAVFYPITGSTILNGEDVRARLVLEAYRRAFPDRVQALEFKDDDWTVLVGGRRFYWARGRLLPEKEKDRWSAYRPHSFYAYPDKQRDPRSYSEERIAELREQGDAEVRLNGIDHHPAFKDALYEGGTRGKAESNLVPVSLFGKTISVHKRIAEPLKRVDSSVSAAAGKDKGTAAFLAGIGSLESYNWREIRGTARRSYHSWGLAIDMLPRKQGPKVMFWEWERDRNPDWMLVPLENRWSPPDAVVSAFEKEGFTWGGKWDFYDMMHFEYRPELLEMKKVLSAVGNPAAEKNERASIYGFGGSSGLTGESRDRRPEE